jgi:hypothetical protein
MVVHTPTSIHDGTAATVITTGLVEVREMTVSGVASLAHEPSSVIGVVFFSSIVQLRGVVSAVG